MKQIFAGCLSILLLISIMVVVVLAGTHAIVDRFADLNESANAALVAQEVTAQVTVSQEQETVRRLKELETVISVVELQEEGLTDRAEMQYDMMYWTSWQSVGHRLLTILLIVAGLLWAVIAVSYFQGAKNAKV